MKTDNLLLIIAIIAVVISIVGAGITYNYINSFRNKLITGLATTGIVNLTVESFAVINFTTNEINWGSGRVDTGPDNATLDTSRNDDSNVTNGNWTGNTDGFVVENIGNVNVTLSLKTGKNAAGFIGGAVGGGPQYQYNVTDIEGNSCETWNITEGAFYDVNTTGDGTFVCNNFQSAGGSNTIRIDVRVVIPTDSAVGALSDTFTATVNQV